MHTTVVTGINGFVGHHVAHAMQQAGAEVIGVGSAPHLATDLISVTEHYYQADLTDPTSAATVPFAEADSIINLAGLTNVGESYQQAERYRVSNALIVENIGQLLLAGNSKARLLAISSGAVYDPTQPTPFTEASPLVDPKKTSPYTASKLLMEIVARQYATKGVDCYIVRPFNHIGPGQQPGFLLPDLAKKIVAAVKAGETEIVTGNLSNQRDFSDVRDVAKAYAAIAFAKPDQLHHDTYNICTGKGLTGQAILDQLATLLDAPHISFKTNPELLRRNDPKILIGSASALRADTGWQPTISIEQTIKDFVSWFQTQ